MPLRATLIMIVTASVLCALALLGLVLGTSPEELGGWGRGLAFGLIFLFVGGMATAVGTMGRRLRRKDDVALRQLMRSLRQGLLFSALITGALALSHLGWLNTWSTLLLVAAAAFLELLFLLSRSRAT